MLLFVLIFLIAILMFIIEIIIDNLQNKINILRKVVCNLRDSVEKIERQKEV